MKDGFKASAQAEEKLNQLIAYLKSLNSVVIGFSGGVDSTFLIWAAKEALGAENVAAVTAVSPAFPKRERNEAIAYCKQLSITHHFIVTHELEIEAYAKNQSNRCYLCKREIFSQIKRFAEEEGYAAVVEGSNLDDNGDYRPGLKAVTELDIKSPLREVGLFKSDIRELSKALDIPTWDKPSFACLATRFAYGETITVRKLAMVEAAEQLLFDLGFKQFRARIHGEDLVRLEVAAEDIEKAISHRGELEEKLKSLGFKFVTLDLSGYRTGSMNATLKQGELWTQ